MKPVLEKIIPKLPLKLDKLGDGFFDGWLHQNAIERYLDYLCDYASFLEDSCISRDYPASIFESTGYINSLFLVVDSLCQEYEIAHHYFTLLEISINSLARAIELEKPKQESKSDPKKVDTTLRECCEKAAMIFQTASENTEESYYKKAYEDKAKEYFAKADEVSGNRQRVSHLQRLRDLYLAAATKYKTTGNLEKLFQKRADAYGEKLGIKKPGIFQPLANAAIKQPNGKEQKLQPLSEIQGPSVLVSG